jgi:hypothetical protein
MTRTAAAAFALALLAGTALAPPAAAQTERRVTLEDQSAIAVTIYNADLALVRDSRRMTLAAGPNRFAFIDVSGRMRAETALLTGPAGAFRLVEQNFDFDLLTPAKLLEKSVGGTVRIVKTHPQTGEETVVEARVLSVANGVVLQIGDQIHTGVPGRLVFDRVPPNLRARPTLVIDLEAAAAGAVPVELTYLTQGLSWRADYVAVLNDKEDRLALNGWVTLVNASGTDYRNAKLQLVAGDPNRVREDFERPRAAPPAPTAGAREEARREAVFDYHLYTIERPTTILNNQQKQVALLKAEGALVEKEYLIAGHVGYYRSRYVGPIRLKAQIFLNLDNEKRANLGLPMPRGVVRVYKQDSAGKAVFVGEDRIDHTAEGEKIRLRVGEAFDVSGERVQTDFTLVVPGGSTYESAFKIVLNNAKDEPVTVTIAEPMPGDWQVLSESHRHVKAAANLATWRVTVPAKGKAEFAYRVRVRY